MKALRLSEEQYAAVLKRNARAISDWSPAPKAHKFNAQKTNGYDSKSEAKRAAELRLLERSGAIANLREQVPFLLIPAQYGTSGELLERACSYIADFVYVENGALVIEDNKGMRAGTAYALYKVKKKLVLQVHGIRIKETGREN